jgi:tetratricopeptide (TPR) repeat protein
MTHDPLASPDPIAQRRFAYAKGEAAEGDWSAEAEMFEQTLERAPGWAAAWFALGEAREKLGDFDAAAQAFQATLAADPADAQGAIGYREFGARHADRARSGEDCFSGARRRRERRGRHRSQASARDDVRVFRPARALHGGDGGLRFGASALLNALDGHLREIRSGDGPGAQHAYRLKRMLADGANENGEIVIPEHVRVALAPLAAQIDALDQRSRRLTTSSSRRSRPTRRLAS